MKKIIITTISVVVILLGTGLSGAYALGLFDQEPWYREPRVDAWAWQGGDTNEIQQTMNAIANSPERRSDPAYFDTVIEYGPGNWVYEWSELGARYERLGLESEIKGQLTAAQDYFMRASVYYSIAKFPLLNEPEKAAYRKSLTNYERAGVYFDLPLEVVTVDYKGHPVRSYLHLPPEGKTGRVPLVIATGGIDVFKVEFYPFARTLNEHGIALATFDLLGTGESDFAPLTNDLEQIHVAFLDYFQSHSAIDPDKIALLGMSFGGNPATKLAFLEEERLAAVVNMCGPIHDVFQTYPLLFNLLPAMTFDTYATRLQAAEASATEIARLAQPFSLVTQGILGQGQTTSVPILSVNATGDRVATEADMRLVTKASQGGEMWLIGQNDHCPPRAEAMTRITNWLEQRLKP